MPNRKFIMITIFMVIMGSLAWVLPDPWSQYVKELQYEFQNSTGSKAVQADSTA